MAIRNDIPYPAFDELLLFCNRLYGAFDGALKKSSPRLTITGLQVLTEIAKSVESRTECTQAQIARTIGVTPSSLVTTIRSLETKGLVVVERSEVFKKHKLELTKLGHRALRRGLVIRDIILESFHDDLPSDDRRKFFASARMANRTFDQKVTTEHQDKYLKSLKKHSTRARVLKARSKG
ncbi:MarR family winged helix-turn-helix transcriptional regulator [Noviluteimonas dokdonensis]|uniref:MarR family winged helix-turn-helix transcriptional regulator n=1 Tax=Noviluteimonas dokdonensis TaxID=414050 RepID=UPI00137837B0|nr:MarR family winged helix-turn-helix transcriptional regulator [Lysobacter dokdonensis]